MKLKKVSHLLIKVSAVAQEILVVFRKFERAARLDPSIGKLTEEPFHEHLSEIVTGAIQIGNLCRNEKGLSNQLQAEIRSGRGYDGLFRQLKSILGQSQTYATKIMNGAISLRKEMNGYRKEDFNKIRDLAKAIKILLQLEKKELPGDVNKIFGRKGMVIDQFGI